ncbi:putative HTH-type transcriptional repressor PurR [uncultured Pleomorphomonas sp.]|uniref:Putative HTH-type transcriptional repressor PurR n=1 Tax=uncultured Pleomorphomonas sp. TaxID=442121 RepID=A0A212LFG3_9HYPH|nr:putative HTH-type transcriptional repressor PurR [uncultured Pleomorphomonas sp.]
MMAAEKSGGRIPTIKDVAKAAGVSQATVSYVLNNLNKVSPEVDAHVRRVAHELGYSRNRAARALKTGRNNVIGCIMPSLLSPVFPEIAQAVQQRAEEHGFATFVIDSGLQTAAREAEAIRVLADHGVDGAIAVLGSPRPASDRPTLPLVVVDQPMDGMDAVYADHREGGRLLAEYAVGLGHRRVGLLSGLQGLYSSRERREGFVEAARGRLDIAWNVEVPLVPSLPREAVDALRRGDVSLVVCVNDLIAMLALSALRQARVRVPEDVSVMGFDDMQWSSWPLLNLTTVRQPLGRLGRDAVDLLVRRLDAPDAEITNIILPVSLIERGST